MSENISEVPIEKETGQIPQKRPPGSYVIFISENMPIYKDKHTNLPKSEIMKMLCDKWKEMSIEQKKPYKDKSDHLWREYKENRNNMDPSKKTKTKKAPSQTDSKVIPVVDQDIKLRKIHNLIPSLCPMNCIPPPNNLEASDQFFWSIGSRPFTLVPKI